MYRGPLRFLQATWHILLRVSSSTDQLVGSRKVSVQGTDGLMKRLRPKEYPEPKQYRADVADVVLRARILLIGFDPGRCSCTLRAGS